MKQSEIETIFEETLKGKNIMTPHIVEYGNSGRFLFEISEGTGFDREPIFGVTVLELLEDETVKRRCDLNKLFDDLEEARTHAEELEELAEEKETRV